MHRIVVLLIIAAAIGVVFATSSACVIGIAHGTITWCGFMFTWPIGFTIAIPIALAIGVPFTYAFGKLGLVRWWQYTLSGLIVAAPVWFALAEPFDSPRWHSSGFFDSLNYLGSGAVGGFVYWWLRRRDANAKSKIQSA